MSKSTPLNQLPNTTSTAVNVVGQQQPPTYNPNIDVQRQSAVQTFIMPQSTATSTDIQAESDATVQEALNMIAPQIPQTPQHIPTESIQMNMQPQNVSNQMMLPQDFMMPNEYQSLSDEPYTKNALSELVSINTDIRTMVIVMIVFVAVSILPVEKFIYNYVALDKIPYSQIAIKAVLAGIIFICINKII